ncbi:MAG: hypothetical protein ACAI38_23365 [Myxococcota bacterium]
MTRRFHATDAYVCLAAAMAVLATGAPARAAETDGSIMLGGKAWSTASTFVQATPTSIIDDVLARVKAQAAAGARPVVIFDLDSTLFDNGPRQERIAHEFARDMASHPELGAEAAKLATFVSKNTSFSMTDMLASCGVDVASDSGKALLEAYKPYWRERFFTGEYAVSDKAYSNAAAVVNRVYHATDSFPAARRVKVIYLSGRHREMEDGTRAALVRDGIPTGDRTALILKHAFAERDEDFKRRAAMTIRAMGRVVAAFDNEPANVAVFVSEFPDAVNVWVRTIDSGRATHPVKGVYTIGDGENDLAGWPSAHRG